MLFLWPVVLLKDFEDYPGILPEIKVIPYCFPEVKQKRRPQPLKIVNFKVLFIGGLSQRKGISHFFV
jgi:hypothetical protein